MDAVMPAAFLGHGSPMNAVESNRYTDAWRAFGRCVPRPRGIVVVSAHWYLAATAVTAMPRPRTIHDFYGFPRALFEVQYPAPGSPSLAEEVADAVRPTHVGLDRETWGIDHGAWSLLVHAFPDADVPVVQLSLHALEGLDHHFEVGARLAPLRERGVLVIGSGNVVHDLRSIDWSRPGHGADWCRRFDEAAREVMTERPHDVARLADHRDYSRSVPTPDHLLPLLHVAGLAAAAGESARVLVEGHAYGSISMTAYVVGAASTEPGDDARPGAPLPDPALVPARDTNT